ncbi:MAG: hypothetical protein QXT97_02515 [Candidatus Diapherotrites archaeon]
MSWTIEKVRIESNGSVTILNTWNHSSPQGILGPITVNVDGGGNCVDASFFGKPENVDIGIDDLIRIKYLGTNIFFGFVSSAPDRTLKDKREYKLLGLSKRLENVVVQNFNTVSVDNSGNFQNVSLSTILTNLLSTVPNELFTSVLNQAPTQNAIKSPVTADMVTLKQVLDELVKITGNSYVWGIDANGVLFFKPKPTSATTDLSTYQKKIKYNNLFSEDKVTSVVFNIQPVNGFYYQTKNTFLDIPQFPEPQIESSSPNFRLRNFKFISPLASQYGQTEKIETLALSDSFIVEVPLNQLPISFFNPNNFVTQSGSSNTTDLINSLSTPGQYIRNNTTPVAFFYVELTQNLDKLMGWSFNYYSTINSGQFTVSSKLFYASVTFPQPIHDELIVEEKYGGITTKKVRVPYGFRPLNLYKVQATNLSNNLGLFFFNSSYVLTGSDQLRISDFRVLLLNTDLLTEYAKTKIRVPKKSPSEITIKTLVNPVLLIANGSETFDVVRIKFEISREGGFAQTFVLEQDPERRSNEFIIRFTQRQEDLRNSILQFGN